jgi:cobalt/nickel transport system permease protein
MTHIMVPDGVLAPWLWIGGWIVAVGCLGGALWATRNTDRMRLVPLAAVLAAVMTVIMSLEIVPLAYEPHLTVLSGIILGPAYAILAVFVFNVLRMLLGDGAVTLLGLNTLLLGLEAVLGYYVFRAVLSAGASLGISRRAGVAAGISTVLALFVATLAFLAVVALGSVPLEALHEGELLERVGTDAPGFWTFAGVVLALAAIGWVIEGIAVGAIVAFLRSVRPALLPAALPGAPEPVLRSGAAST